MCYESVIRDLQKANYRYRITNLSRSRIVIVPTLLDGEMVYFIAWVEGNRMELYRFFKRFSYHSRLIYMDNKALWRKRSKPIVDGLYQFKGF